MKRLRVRIKLVAPVIISSASGDSTMTQTLSYIPGSTVLGLLANLYIRKHGLDGFNRLFMMGSLRFLNLYPYANGKEYMPCPQNLWSEKRVKQGTNNKFQNMFDREDDKDNSILGLKKGGGFVYRDVFETRKTSVFEPPKQLAFHHRRDYGKGISKSGVVFTYEALAAGNEFCGYIVGKEEDLRLMQDLLEAQGDRLRLGRSKTAQYGKCELVESAIEELPKSQVKAEDKYLLLCSDTILYNEAGTSCVGKDRLAELLGVNIEDAFMESGRYETAVSILKAKRPSEYTLKAGSIFKLEKLPENHQELQLYGIGERRWEGFGELMFVNVSEEPYSIIEERKQRVKEPSVVRPDIVSNICAATLRRLQIAELKRTAYYAAAKYSTNSLSNSLVSRLDSFVDTGDFKVSLESLKKTARDKLGDVCARGQHDKSLLDFLNGIKDEVKDILEGCESDKLGDNKKLSDLKEEFKLTGINEQDALENYLHTFFLTLRRMIKQDKKQEANNDQR